MKQIKITSKRKFKKTLAQMLDKRFDETQDTFYHVMNFNLKSFRRCRIVKFDRTYFSLTKSKIVYLGYNIFYDETENSNRFDDARI